MPRIPLKHAATILTAVATLATAGFSLYRFREEQRLKTVELKARGDQTYQYLNDRIVALEARVDTLLDLARDRAGLAHRVSPAMPPERDASAPRVRTAAGAPASASRTRTHEAASGSPAGAPPTRTPPARPPSRGATAARPSVPRVAPLTAAPSADVDDLIRRAAAKRKQAASASVDEILQSLKGAGDL